MAYIGIVAAQTVQYKLFLLIIVPLPQPGYTVYNIIIIIIMCVMCDVS